MSFELYSENGFEGQLASNMGFAEMISYVNGQPGALDLKAFFKAGKTLVPEKVADDINYLFHKTVPPTIKTTLQGLLDHLNKIKEVAIITQ